MDEETRYQITQINKRLASFEGSMNRIEKWVSNHLTQISTDIKWLRRIMFYAGVPLIIALIVRMFL